MNPELTTSSMSRTSDRDDGGRGCHVGSGIAGGVGRLGTGPRGRFIARARRDDASDGSSAGVRRYAIAMEATTMTTPTQSGAGTATTTDTATSTQAKTHETTQQ